MGKHKSIRFLGLEWSIASFIIFILGIVAFIVGLIIILFFSRSPESDGLLFLMFILYHPRVHHGLRRPPHRSSGAVLGNRQSPRLIYGLKPYKVLSTQHQHI